MTTFGFCITELPSGSFSLRENDSPHIDTFDTFDEARALPEGLFGGTLAWKDEDIEDAYGLRLRCWYAEFTLPR